MRRVVASADHRSKSLLVEAQKARPHNPIIVGAIERHSQVTKCDAWSSPIEGSTKQRYIAVLHVPPIDSPEKAIRGQLFRIIRRRENLIDK